MLRASLTRLCAAPEPLVKVSQQGAVAILTLNRPKALNALNQYIAAELAAAALKADKDDSVNAIVITGSGRSFVAGADIKMMQPMSFADWNTNNLFADLELLRNVRKPIVAL